MKYTANSQTQTGITLVELLIVIAIAAILASLAGPSFTDFINRTRQNSVVSQLVSDLNRARSEAIKRNTPVLLCERDTDTACANTKNWQSGWLVCVDADVDKQCDPGTVINPNPLVVHAALPTTLTLVGDVSKVKFRPNGSSGFGAVTLTAGGTGLADKIVRISVTGNISRP